MKLQLSAIVLLLTVATDAFSAVPSYEDVRARYSASDAVLLDRHGEVIHELRIDPHGRRLSWTKRADLSPAVVKAVVRSEDKRFYGHRGADWPALISASFGKLFSDGRRGASTITMQLAALFDEGLRAKRRQRSIGEKWEQIKAAREIERSWTKEQILEAYLNLVSFRGELQGIASASRGIFDKDPSGLDEAEGAILAALIRSPNAPPERVGERAELLAASPGATMPPGTIKRLAIDRLSKPYTVRKRIDLAPHAARMLLHEGMASARSTLDSRIQRFTAGALQQAVGLLSDQNVRDGAALVVDNRTGEILAYVGNVGSGSSAGYVDGIQARRQAGSTLKPFLYGLAIEKRIVTAASLLEDSPLDFPTERGIYRPENYDKEFRGFVPVRTALASSLNVPAVRTLNLVGVSAFAAALREFGFGGLKDAEYYGPSLALGTADVSLEELVNAYRTLANSGVWSALRISPEEKDGRRRRALTREASFIISTILSDREARSSTFSLESPLATPFWTAAKTGTSKDMRDNWCIGYSDRYTVGVWVGNFSGESMWNVSGVAGAAPVWLEIMISLHGAMPSRPPSAPPRVVSQAVHFAKNGEARAKQEWFIAGTEQDSVRPGEAEKSPRILYPAAGTIIAVDPDIPDDLQQVLLEASTRDPSVTMMLDGVSFKPPAAWRPVAGMHVLNLVKGNGAVLDRITFEVR